MKFKNNLTSTLFALSLLGLSSVAYGANTPSFTVTKYNLTGYTDPSYIKPAIRNELVLLLKSYTGNDVTVAKLNELKEKIQVLLNKEAKGVFTVNIPPQRITNGAVVYNVNFVAGKVEYLEAPGFDKENVKRSVPSLKDGIQFIAGRPWVDERELTMAIENPLKTTQIQYELQPGQPIVAKVQAIAPRGKHLRFVTVDNSGSRRLDYLRFQAGYVNGNFSGKDDLLNLLFVSNFKRPQEAMQFGGSYSFPAYKLHSRFDAVYFHSSSDMKNLKIGDTGLKLDATGGADILKTSWAYYLPHYDFGYSNQIKFNIGYTFRRLKQSTIDAKSGSTIGADGFYFISPFNVGFSGQIKPMIGIDIDFNLSYNFLYAGILGSDQVYKLRTFGQRLVSGEKYQDSWTGNLNARFDLPQGFVFSTSNRFQYSNKHLFSTERYGNDVRGFRDGAGSGDLGASTKNELLAPNLSSRPELSVRPYTFVDVGIAKWNRNPTDVKNNPSLNFGTYGPEEAPKEYTRDWVASAGLGAKVSFKDFSADVSAVRKLRGTDGTHDRTTIWFNATYRF